MNTNNQVSTSIDSSDVFSLNGISQARLPAWALPDEWPIRNGEPLCADIVFSEGKISSLTPCRGKETAEGFYHIAGSLVLPGLVEPHCHLDKTFTLRRSPPESPGLLAAIHAMKNDRQYWDEDDLSQRALQAIDWANKNGVMHLRTHIDWSEKSPPLAWHVINRLQQPGITLEKVALVPLEFFSDKKDADEISDHIQKSGENCLLGAFVHSSNWNPDAMFNLMESARTRGLNLDLHIDEEISPLALGMTWLADYLETHGYPGHICCSHGCALASTDEQQADRILSVLSQHRVTLVILPMTNLLLQDAMTDRTPKWRGITLLKEAQNKGIPVVLGCDNVQDAFCPSGSYDPLDTLSCALFAIQLDQAFDKQSQLICDLSALTGQNNPYQPLLPGAPANFVIYSDSDCMTWPLRSHYRQRISLGCMTT